MKRVLLSFAVTLLLTGCGEKSPPTAETAPPAVAAPPSNGFTIEVSLSPAAAARLAQGEGIIISATLGGQALPAFKDQADELGEIDLGQEKVTGPGRAGPVAITGANFKLERASQVEGGRAEVNVNVYSARQTSADNLLACDPLVHGPIGDIAGKTHRVHCKLISEN